MYRTLFSTKCWEQDWQFLQEWEYDLKYELNKYNFTEKWIIINNVDNPQLVKEVFKSKVDKVFLVDDHIKDALDFFDIDVNSFDGKSYLYSAAEIVELYMAGTYKFDFLTHYSSDCRLSYSGNWIDTAINILENDNSILAVSPSPDQDCLQLDCRTFWFSDQVFTLRVSDWYKKGIMNYKTPPENQYPDYGGLSFERRAGRAMINLGKQRLWLHNFRSIHPVV
jgi:hypothetical protein